MPEYEDTPPRADAMVESMRAFGYTLESALADVVDNSITAHAKNVWINFHWNGKDSAIVILDDGEGMTEKVLVEAMRPGSISPLEERRPDDLGRFGLGLKTASFSQCRLLTVSSRPDREKEYTRVWDLDYIMETREWRLYKDSLSITRPFLGELGKVQHGTLVIWQKIDRIIDPNTIVDDRGKDYFLQKVNTVENHLAMTYHRFLEGKQRLHIFIQGREVTPWDPFLQNETATQELYEEALRIFEKRLNVRPFVLPHISHLTPDIHDRAAGPKGWNAQQGFYIYRNKRLIVAGSWLDLGFRQEEHCKLARILVDLPNNMDHEWQLDVKKAHATPPPGLVGPLRRIARITRARATEIYRHRGQIIRRKHAQDYHFVWQEVIRNQKSYFKVNRSHPIVKNALRMSQETTKQIKTVLELLENTLPIESIWIRNAESPDCMTRSGDWETPAELQRHGLQLYKAFLRDGMSKEDAYKNLVLIEPFDRFPVLLARVEEFRGKKINDE